MGAYLFFPTSTAEDATNIDHDDVGEASLEPCISLSLTNVRIDPSGPQLSF